MNEHEHNINPNWWGPAAWRFMYSFISVYPQNSDKECIEGTIQYFNSLKSLLPCSGCRNSYSVFITEEDTNINNHNNFTSRDNIILFVFNLREKVNIKVDRQYCLTYQYFKKKLDVMICDKNNKLSGYANIMTEVPFIHSHLELQVFKYLKDKTKYDYKKTKIILKKSKKFISDPIFNPDNKHFIFFFFRSVKCRNIYSKLFNSIHVDKITIEDSFLKYKSLHNKLLSWGCTFLTSEQLLNFIEK